MKESSKQEVKKNVVTGVSTAAGAVLGTIIEDAFESHASNTQKPTTVDAEVSEMEGKENNNQEQNSRTATTENKTESVIQNTNEVNVEVTEGETSIEAVGNDSEETVAGEDEVFVEVSYVGETDENDEVEIVGVVNEPITYVEESGIENEVENLVAVIEAVDEGEEFAEVEVAVEEVLTYEGEEPDYFMEEQILSESEPMEFDDLMADHTLDTRIGDFGMADYDLSSDGMADYINDANIDAFTDMD